MSTLKKIRLIAVDTNGVLLNDIFAESLRHFVERHGGVYTAELERIVLGAPHIAGGHALSAACGLALTAQECIHLFLEEHKVLTRDRPVTLHPAAPAVLEALAGLGARVTTYGGRPSPAMLDGFLAPCLPWLDADAPYVDMDGFRPGMKEIARDVFGCAFDEVVFIDDLSKVAGASRALGAGFVGLPSTPFQRDQMAALGVRHMVSRLEDLDADVVRRVDADLAAGSAWPIAAAA